MNANCFNEHPGYIKRWKNGMQVCLLCAAKGDIAQVFKTTLLREKLHKLEYNVCVDPVKKTKPNARTNRVACEKCGSFQVLYRIKINSFRCLLCGWLTPKKDET